MAELINPVLLKGPIIVKIRIVAELIGTATTTKDGLAWKGMIYRVFNITETSYIEMDITDYNENFYVLTHYQNGRIAMGLLMLSTYNKDDVKFFGIFNTGNFDKKLYIKDNKFYFTNEGGNSRFAIRSILHNVMTLSIHTGSFDTSGATEISKVE